MPHTPALFSLIATLGWKDFTPEKASQVLDIPLNEIPEKEQVLQSFHQMITQKLKTTIDFEDLKAAPFKDQVMEIMLCRLELLSPYKPSLERIYADLKEDLCSAPSFLWQAKFETEWLDLLATQNPIQTKLLGLLYGVVIVHWLQEDDLNKTIAFLDRVLNAVPISSIL